MGKPQMSREGYMQGDMKPNVKDYQKSEKCFSQKGFGTTLDYMNRQDRMQSKEASDLRKQDYKGRYS